MKSAKRMILGKRRSIAMALSFGLVLVLGSLVVWAQQSLRELPAAANPPAQEAELQAELDRRIPDPPARGQGRGRVLQASAQPPAAERDLEQELNRQIPNPPGRARASALIEKIQAQPGGRERAEAARSGSRPGQTQGQGRGGRPQASVGDPSNDGSWLARLGSFFIEDAHAQSGVAIELTPQVNSIGSHASLLSSSPYASVYVFGSYVNYSVPKNASVYFTGFDTSTFGGASGRTSPAVRFAFNAPAEGWYIVNMNCWCYGSGSLDINHFEGSNPYTTIEEVNVQSGQWADYPTLQYLAAGFHYFSFVPPANGYMSRVTLDSYP